jgi:hypothetical protein
VTEPRTDRTSGPMELAAIVVAVTALLLLLGNVLFAFATADANGADASDRFRLLGQAANPFIAFLSLSASGLVVHQRQRGGIEQVGGGAALGIGNAVGLAVALLALNGVLTDLTGDGGALFTLSAVISRLAAIGLSGLTLWLSVTAVPPKPPEPPAPPAR